MNARFRHGRPVALWLLVWAVTAPSFLSAEDTALDEYVAKPDPAYGYRLRDTRRTLTYTTYFVTMTSQQWRDPAEVDRTQWDHEVQITVPTIRHSASPRTAILIINGGKNGTPPSTETGELMSSLAIASGSVVAMVSQIPNQPLSFADEVDRPRTEDAIIAYSLDKFIATGDSEWPVLLAMTKAVVRTMDTVQELLASEGIAMDDFILLGGSKRGWTAWLTAAVDHRVKALAPISIDLLNMSKQFTHHWEALGFYTPAINDYVEFDLPCRSRSKRGQDLMRIIDPFSYRDRYGMPKLIINSAGDQFFVSDSSRLYFDELSGPKHLRYTFNTDHRQGEEIAQLLDVALASLAWIDDVNNNRPGPRFSWTAEDDGSLRVIATDQPDAVNLVQATNPSARDFRLETIGAAWTRTRLLDQGRGIFVGYVDPPAAGWTAFAVELSYGTSPTERQIFTTDVRVTPALLPFAGTACLATTPGYLDNPQPGGRHSGIGVISGWVCDAEHVDVGIDDVHVLATSYGTPRGDTRPICGDHDNGFGLLFNLNLLGTGEHRVQAMADGRTIASASFQVQTLGQEFLRGVSGTYDLAGFPYSGLSTRLLWEEGLQNFAISGVRPLASTPLATIPPIPASSGVTGFFENPRHDSTPSGIFVISGWVCDADLVEIAIDGGPRLTAPYGTSRGDTKAVCGDIDNGFGLLININLLGDGPHTVIAFADGPGVIGSASFNVVTFGGEFIRGLEGTYELSDFPYSGDRTTIQWQESIQNFSIRSFSPGPRASDTSQ